MQNVVPATRRLRAVALALLLVAGCGGQATPTGSPAGGPSAPIVAPTADGTGGSGGPRASQSPGPLPQPTLTDPTEIGVALWDPARVEAGVVSLVEQLGIDIFTAEGEILRDAAAQGPTGFWLFEAEVRGLIEMGQADAAAIAAGGAPFTLVNLYEGLSPVYPELSQDQLLDAYIQAYRAAPGDLVRESFAGHAFVPEAAFTRVHLWLFVLDGVLGRPQPATATARTVAFTGGVTAASPVAHVDLPDPSSALAAQMAIELASLPIVIAHMSTLAFTLPVDFTISASTVHEGHGGYPGDPATLTLKSRFVPAPLVSPILQLPLLVPNRTSLEGLPVHFRSLQMGVLEAHGTLSPTPLVTVFTDILGEARLEYTPRAEPADGQGDLKTDVAIVNAEIELREILLYMYPAGGAANLGVGTRIIPLPLVIEWHEELPAAPGRWEVDLTGPKDGAGHYSGTANSLCTHQPGSPFWTAVAQPVGAEITMIDLSSNPDRDVVGVSARQTSDFSGLWSFSSDSPNTFVEVVGDDTGGPVVRGTARYTDTEGRVFTAAVTVFCSQTF